MRKGFTLIELMIVVAIIAIIAAIAIPNLLESRIQANETNAIAACKSYASAQNTFLKANYSAKIDSTQKQFYCTTFSKLYYLELSDETGATRKLALIPQVFANATTSADGYQGYYFKQGSVTKYSFSLYANPCIYSKSGVNSFYVDTTGSVLGKDNGGTPVVSGKPDATWFTP